MVPFGTQDLKRLAVNKGLRPHFHLQIQLIHYKLRHSLIDSLKSYRVANLRFPSSEADQCSKTLLRIYQVLRLHQRDEALEASDINTGLFCFVERKPGEIVCLGLPQPDGAVSSEKATWMTFIAKNDGNFSNSELSLVIPKLTDDRIETNDKNATVVSKLRYEYALNYVQKVGASVTRIGLDYTS